MPEIARSTAVWGMLRQFSARKVSYLGYGLVCDCLASGPQPYEAMFNPAQIFSASTADRLLASLFVIVTDRTGSWAI